MTTTTVQARVTSELKQEAEAVLAAIGLSTSDSIRLFLQQVVNSGGLPFKPTAKQPNAETMAAMMELEDGEGKRFSSVEDLFDSWD